MHAAEIPFGGGVSRRFTRRLRGQSTVEYVLVIAIIGLVVLIAGPWVSSAIRNQFNTVAGTLGNGIDKGSWETGSTGGGAAAMRCDEVVETIPSRRKAIMNNNKALCLAGEPMRDSPAVLLGV